MSGLDTAGKGRHSELPPVSDIAEQIRDGATVAEVCEQYDIAKSTLQSRFNLAGYVLSTGEPQQQGIRHNRLESQHVGAGGQHVGGGDYQGLPTKPVQYQGKPRGSSIDWDQIREGYIANGGHVDDTVWTNPAKVEVIEGGATSSRAAVHTFELAENYEEHVAPRQRRPKNTETVPRIYQVQPEQRPEIARRYAAGESIPGLAKVYGVSDGSIRYAIKATGTPIRTKKEAAELYRDRSKS